MKQITLTIPDNKFSFFIALLKKLDFVKIEKPSGLQPIPKGESEQEAKEWYSIAIQSMAKTYSDDEPDYSDVTLMEPNPEYKAWKKGQ